MPDPFRDRWTGSGKLEAILLSRSHSRELIFRKSCLAFTKKIKLAASLFSQPMKVEQYGNSYEGCEIALIYQADTSGSDTASGA